MSLEDITRARFAATAAKMAALGDSRVAGLRTRLAALLSPAGDEVALDAGTGTGPIAFALAPLVREVIAVDLVPEMLELGRERAGEGSNVRFVLGDALALPVEDGSVDIALSSRTLHHVDDPGRSIAELARVIAPGGRAVVVDQVCSEDAHEAELYERLESMRDPSHVRTLPDSEVRRLLFDAGLVVEHAELEPEERDLAVFLDLANCEGEQRAMVFAYVEELVAQGESAGVDLRRSPDGFHFTGTVGWYVARKPA